MRSSLKCNNRGPRSRLAHKRLRQSRLLSHMPYIISGFADASAATRDNRLALVAR